MHFMIKEQIIPWVCLKNRQVRLWILKKPYSLYQANAYLHQCMTLRYIFCLWGLVLKRFYAAYFQFIGSLWKQMLNKFNYWHMITIFLILKLIFESNWELKWTLWVLRSKKLSQKKLSKKVFSTRRRAINRQ